MTEVPEYLSYVFHEPTTLSSEEKGYPRKALPSTMPVKLFAHTNETESKQVMALLEDAEIDYELMEVLEHDHRFMPHLHLSIQHGDDLILKRMKRRHLYRDVINLVNEARRRRPEITFGADIISGFPTETSQAHRNTLKLIKEANINFVHAFPFSPREGTPAAKMKMLTSEIINKRAKEIRDLGHKNKIKYSQEDEPIQPHSNFEEIEKKNLK